MQQLSALRNHILFQFVDGQTNHMGAKQFETKTDWDFSFVKVDDSTRSARWGTITHVGPDCEDQYTPGMKVLIDPLMWSEGFDFKNERFWRTDDRQIALIDTTTEG